MKLMKNSVQSCWTKAKLRYSRHIMTSVAVTNIQAIQTCIGGPVYLTFLQR